MPTTRETDPVPAQTSSGEPPMLLVGNPTSRGGKAAERFEEIRALMEEAHLDYEFRSTLPDGGTVDLVTDAVEEGFRTLVCIGGDGTFNEIAKGVCRSGRSRDVRIGLLPSGTANDQGKSFGISSTAKALKQNVKLLAAGHVTQLDVGEVTAYSESDVVLRRDLFFDSAGWGLSAAILAFRNNELDLVRKVPVVRDMYRDQMVYVRAAVHELALSWVTRDRFTAIAEIDGETFVLDKLSDLVVSNTPVYAGEWVIDADTATQNQHNDGRLEVVPFRGVRDWTSKLVLHHKRNPLTEELVNRIGLSHSPTYSGALIVLRFDSPKKKPLPAQLDGEEFSPADRFEIRVHKRLLNLIVPNNFHWI